MHHPRHTTTFVTPVVEHWLEQEIGQWVRPMKDRSDNPSHMSERSYHGATSCSLEPSSVKLIKEKFSNVIQNRHSRILVLFDFELHCVWHAQLMSISGSSVNPLTYLVVCTSFVSTERSKFYLGLAA